MTLNTFSTSDPVYPQPVLCIRAAGAVQRVPIGARRISIAATTTVYLDVRAVFTVSTCAAFGGIRARRVR